MKGLPAYRYLVFPAILLLFLVPGGVQAQDQPALYIQAENNLPFEARWNGKTYASSTSGYLAIPQVAGGAQVVEVSIGAEETAVFRFTISISHAAKAFTLRQWIDNRWSLLDLEDLSFTAGELVIVPKETPWLMPNNNNPPTVVTTEKPQVQITVKNAETTAVAKPAEPVVEKKKLPVVTGITKIFDRSGSGGVDQVYVLNTGTKADTVALFIPALQEETKTGTNPAAAVQDASLKHRTAPLRIAAPGEAVLRREQESFSLN